MRGAQSCRYYFRVDLGCNNCCIAWKVYWPRGVVSNLPRWITTLIFIGFLYILSPGVVSCGCQGFSIFTTEKNSEKSKLLGWKILRINDTWLFLQNVLKIKADWKTLKKGSVNHRFNIFQSRVLIFQDFFHHFTVSFEHFSINSFGFTGYCFLPDIKSWKTSAVRTTAWMVETQLCKLRGTSDTFVWYGFCGLNLRYDY